jgi:HPt (histidine-containing phosphotransfer) domain-containing protein
MARPPEDGFAQQMAALRSAYVRELPAKARRVAEALAAAFERSAEPERRWHDAIHEAHRLRGSAALYGLEAVMRAAAALEEALIDARVRPSDRSDEALRALAAALERTAQGACLATEETRS